MDDKSVLIRDINRLKLSPKARQLAENLLNCLDVPAVFLLDSPGDKNYAARNPYLHNQFWVTLQHQTEQSEFERIILAHLYRGLQIRRRYSYVFVTKKQQENLMASGDRAQIERVIGLTDKINAFVTTLDAELYLKRYGIVTSQKVRREQFQNRIQLLSEYLEMQQKQPGFFWYEETCICNMIDYGNFFRLNDSYKRQLIVMMKRIQPPFMAEKLIDQAEKIESFVEMFIEEWTPETGLECCEWMFEKVVTLFSLQDTLDIRPEYAMENEVLLPSGQSVPVCSYVPEGISEEALILESMRTLNSGLVLLQEQLNTFHREKFVDVHVNLILSKECNAYAYGNRKKGYYVAYLEGLILKICQKVREEDMSKVLPQDLMQIIGIKEAEKRLRRYVFYFSILHEYGHIIAGDCDDKGSFFSDRGSKQETREAKERKADEYANKMLLSIMPMQYRPESADIQREIRKMQCNIKADALISKRAISILQEIRVREVEA